MVSRWDARGEDLLFAVYPLRRTDHEKKETNRIISARQASRIRSGRHIPDSAIDFSDLPELSDEQLKRMCRIGRLATGMVEQLVCGPHVPASPGHFAQMAAKRGKPYQTLIHELLEKAASQAV
ncbi:MAG: hypothetical protein HOO98_02365 [Nitrospira sp.]|nr:hypothetical protein [Nitrospira sp.]